MARWIPGVLVLFGVSGCGQTIGDCFCQPGHLGIPPGQSTLLAAVPRGCGRTESFLLSIGEPRVIPAIAVVSAASTNPHIKIEFPPPPTGNVGQGEFIQLEVTTDVPLDAPSLLQADIDLVTDTGVPRTFSFQLNVPVIAAEAPPGLDFGGVAFGTTATRTLEVTNTALAQLRLEPYLESADFQAAFSTTPLMPAQRNAQGQLVPGRTMIEVTFTPHAVGPQTQELGAFANWLSVSTPLRFHVSGVGL